MFIRKKKNKSGVVSVQIIDTSSGKPKLFKTVGSSSQADRVRELVKQAQVILSNYKKQSSLNFTWQEDGLFLSQLRNGIKQIQVIGPELILGKLFDEIGFNQIKDELFRQLVIARLIYPLSKLKTTEYLMRYNGKRIDVERIYRFLDRMNTKYKEQAQHISYQHTLKVLGNTLSVVFYDVTTLYFEASEEDDLRKIGFSKDNKAQHPQIVLGLLVSQHGYPLAYEMFEGNKFEGHTMLPILEAFKKKYQLKNLTIVADAGLLSSDNVEQLKKGGYEFILGGRMKNENKNIQHQILSHRFKDGESILITKEDSTKLIVGYANARAKKDAYNRKKGLKKLEQSLMGGILNKQHINNRGYNKYLQLKGQTKVSIDYEKFKADGRWDGLKGYITNTSLSKEAIIENYKHLWYIEKAFRVSKTDLRVRPIYHRTKA